MQAIFSQEYLVYCKKKWCSTAELDLLLGHVDGFHIDPRAMELSTRACNCLSRAGCTSIADVVELSDYTIATMRNMGSKTASEVAHWLDAHGICFSAWSKFL